MNFIELYTNLDDALNVRESVQDTIYNYSGIQLLPNQTNPYYQTTESINGVELEDWQVYAVNLRTGVKTDITSSFSVFDNFFLSDGTPQITFALTNLPELGWDFIYLEVNQMLGETYYSNVFKITNIRSKYTSRFDYKDKKKDIYNSIQLNVWFRQYLNRDEVTTYYEVSTKQQRTVAIKEATVSKYFTEIINIGILKKLRDLLNKRYKYIDLQGCSLFEAFEIPELTGNGNFSQQSILLNVDKNDLLTENINEMGVLEDIEWIKKVLVPVTNGGVIFIWNRPVSEIPDGYREVTILAGKTIMGFDSSLTPDPDFSTLGATGGVKENTLTSANIPEHTHKMFVNESANIATNRINLFPDRNATYRGTGEGSADHDYTISSSTTDPSLGNTGKYGTATPDPIDNLSPYRIVNFIEWDV